MWNDRYFEMKIEGKKGSSWYTLWSAKSSKFTWNFGSDRSFSKSVSASPKIEAFLNQYQLLQEEIIQLLDVCLDILQI